MEKNNDDVRKFHLTKSNKWDAPKDVLLASKRLQITGQQEREKRRYNKSNADYWSTEILETRRKRRRLPAAPSEKIPESNPDYVLDIQNLSAFEIKQKLKELGVQTKVRKLEKLQDILRAVLLKD